MSADIRQYFTRISSAVNAEQQNYILENANVVDNSLSGDHMASSTEIQNILEEVPNEPSACLSRNNAEIEYELIPGKRKNSQLVYLKKDKFLFTPINGDSKNGKRYSCITPSCPARIILRLDGICEITKRSKPHILHSDHSQKREEFLATKKIKESCADVDLLCGGSSINVSVKSIFDNEVLR